MTSPPPRAALLLVVLLAISSSLARASDHPSAAVPGSTDGRGTVERVLAARLLAARSSMPRPRARVACDRLASPPGPASLPGATRILPSQALLPTAPGVDATTVARCHALFDGPSPTPLELDGAPARAIAACGADYLARDRVDGPGVAAFLASCVPARLSSAVCASAGGLDDAACADPAIARADLELRAALGVAALVLDGPSLAALERRVAAGRDGIREACPLAEPARPTLREAVCLVEATRSLEDRVADLLPSRRLPRVDLAYDPRYEPAWDYVGPGTILVSTP